METLESNSTAEETQNRGDSNVSREDFGALQHGCEHYRRRCKLRAPCCDRIFTCRHCHNDATSTLSNPKDRHELVRPDVKQVVCAVCNTEQQVSNLCSNCGVKFGEYFCDICKFYDDDITKEQFHCNDCGICRVGGRENFFHCPKCGSCYSVGLRNNHKCVEDSMKSHCPICYEFLFDSTKLTTIMKCGHTIHVDCYEEMINQNQYRCPICSKSLSNMSSTWERLDQEIAATAMPEEYRYQVEILCNDCNKTGKAFFHIIGHKCSHCSSYNTRAVTGDHMQQASICKNLMLDASGSLHIFWVFISLLFSIGYAYRYLFPLRQESDGDGYENNVCKLFEHVPHCRDISIMCWGLISA